MGLVKAKFEKNDILHKATDKSPVANKIVLEVKEKSNMYVVCSANDPSYKQGGATARHIAKSEITFITAHEEYRVLNKKRSAEIEKE